MSEGEVTEDHSCCGLVLVVEDEPALRELVVETLEDYGYTVAAAGGGEEAVEILRKHGPSVRVMLTDVRMPGMRGTELAKLAKDMNPRLRVVFMSGYSEDFSLGAAVDDRPALLHKPFTTEMLCSRLEAMFPLPAAGA